MSRNPVIHSGNSFDNGMACTYLISTSIQLPGLEEINYRSMWQIGSINVRVQRSSFGSGDTRQPCYKALPFRTELTLYLAKATAIEWVNSTTCRTIQKRPTCCYIDNLQKYDIEFINRTFSALNLGDSFTTYSFISLCYELRTITITHSWFEIVHFFLMSILQTDRASDRKQKQPGVFDHPQL